MFGRQGVGGAGGAAVAGGQLGAELLKTFAPNHDGRFSSAGGPAGLETDILCFGQRDHLEAYASHEMVTARRSAASSSSKS